MRIYVEFRGPVNAVRDQALLVMNVALDFDHIVAKSRGNQLRVQILDYGLTVETIQAVRHAIESLPLPAATIREVKGGLDVPDTEGIEELDFSVRTYNVLKRAGIDTVGDLRNLLEDNPDLTGIRNTRPQTFTELAEKFPWP